MPYTAAHGPPAKDATHQWAPAAGTPPPVLNDTNTDVAVFPRTAIETINNWRALPELVDNRAGRTYGAGEIAYPPRVLGKTIVYECTLQGTDRPDFIAEQHAIVQGFADRDEGVMTVTPWPAPGGVVWTYTARVLDLQFDPEWRLDGESEITYEWGFVLTLRMSDARFFTDGTGYY